MLIMCITLSCSTHLSEERFAFWMNRRMGMLAETVPCSCQASQGIINKKHQSSMVSSTPPNTVQVETIDRRPLVHIDTVSVHQAGPKPLS